MGGPQTHSIRGLKSNASLQSPVNSKHGSLQNSNRNAETCSKSKKREHCPLTLGEILISVCTRLRNMIIRGFGGRTIYFVQSAKPHRNGRLLVSWHHLIKDSDFKNIQNDPSLRHQSARQQTCIVGRQTTTHH